MKPGNSLTFMTGFSSRCTLRKTTSTILRDQMARPFACNSLITLPLPDLSSPTPTTLTSHTNTLCKSVLFAEKGTGMKELGGGGSPGGHVDSVPTSTILRDQIFKAFGSICCKQTSSVHYGVAV